eukprot:11217123-Lingulodinium_polyedra.AAC.1
MRLWARQAPARDCRSCGRGGPAGTGPRVDRCLARPRASCRILRRLVAPEGSCWGRRCLLGRRPRPLGRRRNPVIS